MQRGHATWLPCTQADPPPEHGICGEDGDVFASRLQPRSAHAGKDARAFSTLVDGIKMLKDNPEVVTEELPCGSLD
jgi:hypothetical protein